jgi:hypothetical protein
MYCMWVPHILKAERIRISDYECEQRPFTSLAFLALNTSTLIQYIFQIKKRFRGTAYISNYNRIDPTLPVYLTLDINNRVNVSVELR